MVFLITLTIAITACKKDKLSTDGIREKIVGKWTFISEEAPSDFASPGETQLLISYGKPGDYFLFDPDGNLNYVMYGIKKNTAYSIESNKKIKFGDDCLYFVDELTNHRLKLTYNSDNYDDTKKRYLKFTR